MVEISLSPCAFIIAQVFKFVKNFFYFLFLDFVRSTWKQSLAFLRIGIRVAFYISLFLYLTFLLYHTLWGLSRGFFNVLIIFFESHSVRNLLSLPLTIIIIPENSKIARWNNAQKKELLFEFSLCILPSARAG